MQGEREVKGMGVHSKVRKLYNTNIKELGRAQEEMDAHRALTERHSIFDEFLFCFFLLHILKHQHTVLRFVKDYN